MKKLLFNKLVVFIFVMLFSIMCISCTQEEDGVFEPLKVSYPSSEYVRKEIDKKNVSLYNKFAIDTFVNLEEKNGNIVFSPASLYMAMSMETEGAKGDTLDELKNALNIDSLETLRSINKSLYETNYYKNKDGKAKIANSYWISPNVFVKEDYQKVLVENYYAQAHFNSFTLDTLSAIAKWINDNTFDFLNVKDSNLKELVGISFALINTIYFNNKWEVEFKKENTRKQDFTLDNGENILVDMMNHSLYTRYYENEKYSLMQDRFYNGNKITFILPQDSINVSDLYAELDTVLTLNKTNRKVNLSLPKFKYTNAHNLVPVMESLGVDSLFDVNKCDLSKISDTNLYCALINQIVGIDLSEEGVKAAAVTIVGDKATSEGPEEVINFVLDRPFIYYIEDANGCILFIGVVQNPNN